MCHICEDCDMVLVLLQGRSVAVCVPFIVIVEFWGFEGKGSLIGAIHLFCFSSWSFERMRTSLHVSQTVWDGMFMYFETLRKETGFRF